MFSQHKNQERNLLNKLKNGRKKEERFVNNTKKHSNMIFKTSTMMLQDQDIQEASNLPTPTRSLNTGEMQLNLMKNSAMKLLKIFKNINKKLHQQKQL